MEDTAKTMDKIQNLDPHDFIVTSGDNVYMFGITSLKNTSKVDKIMDSLA